VLICNYLAITMVVMENNVSYNNEMQTFATCRLLITIIIDIKQR